MNLEKALKILENNNDILDGYTCGSIISGSTCEKCIIYKHFGERYNTLCDTGSKELAQVIRAYFRKEKLRKLLEP